MKSILLVSMFLVLVASKTIVRKQRQWFSSYQSYKYSIPKRPFYKLSSSQQFQLDFNRNINRNDDKSDEISAYRDDDSSSSNENQTNKLTKSEGSFCRRSFDGLSGYCMLAFQCLHIVREFRKHGTKIDVCSYQKSVPIICCPLEEKNNFTKKTNQQQRISGQKCSEYNEITKQMESHYRRRIYNEAKKCESSVPLIVGGVKTFSGEYPHMAAIGWRRISGGINWACGGTLISEKYILTAAHCTLFGGKPPDIVRLGAQNLYIDNDNVEPKEYDIINITVHHKYNTTNYYHDIALLKLSKNVIFTKFIKPACLWQFESLDDIEITTAIGWGRMRFLGPKSEELLKVDLKIIDQSKCNVLYQNENKLPNGITNQQFCAGYLDGGKDTCQGDSGGPIHVQMPKHDCINYVIGITSFGKFCASPNAPGVYIKISSYLDWIENIAFI